MEGTDHDLLVELVGHIKDRDRQRAEDAITMEQRRQDEARRVEAVRLETAAHVEAMRLETASHLDKLREATADSVDKLRIGIAAVLAEKLDSLPCKKCEAGVDDYIATKNEVKGGLKLIGWVSAASGTLAGVYALAHKVIGHRGP